MDGPRGDLPRIGWELIAVVKKTGSQDPGAFVPRVVRGRADFEKLTPSQREARHRAYEVIGEMRTTGSFSGQLPPSGNHARHRSSLRL